MVVCVMPEWGRINEEYEGKNKIKLLLIDDTRQKGRRMWMRRRRKRRKKEKLRTSDWLLIAAITNLGLRRRTVLSAGIW